MIKQKINNEIVYLNSWKVDQGVIQDYFFDLYSRDKMMLLECWVRFTPELEHFELKSITALRDQNKGYGSFVMKKVIELAKELEVDYIKGYISPHDIQTDELKSKVYGFYRKHLAEKRLLIHNRLKKTPQHSWITGNSIFKKGYCKAVRRKTVPFKKEWKIRRNHKFTKTRDE